MSLFYNRVEVGQMLEESRKEAKMSRRTVSDHLGYESTQHIYNIERGLSPAPLKLFAEFAKLYKIEKEVISQIMVEGLLKEIDRIFD